MARSLSAVIQKQRGLSVGLQRRCRLCLRFSNHAFVLIFFQYRDVRELNVILWWPLRRIPIRAPAIATFCGSLQSQDFPEFDSARGPASVSQAPTVAISMPTAQSSSYRAKMLLAQVTISGNLTLYLARARLQYTVKIPGAAFSSACAA